MQLGGRTKVKRISNYSPTLYPQTLLMNILNSPILAACYPFALFRKERNHQKPLQHDRAGKSEWGDRRSRTLTHSNPIPKRKRDTLRFATNTDVANDSARIRFLDAEIGERVFP
jgi:hypothetical protein